jgi:hypothetical protein
MIWKTLGKKETKTQNTVEGHSEDKNNQKTESWNLKMKWKLKEKLKIFSQTTQDL